MQSARKIAVTGATGRVGRHVVDVLEVQGHDVVPISRSNGVDLITGEGLAAALAGVESVVDAATQPLNDQDAATAFFTTSAHNLQEAGAAAGVQRIVAVSIVGADRFTGGFIAASAAHEQADARGADPGANPARDAVPRVRPADGGVGQAGRRDLRAANAHPARGGQERRRGARRPGDRLGKWAGARRRSRPRDRRPAGGAARRDRETGGFPARRRTSRRGGGRSRPTRTRSSSRMVLCFRVRMRLSQARRSRNG